MIESIRCPGCGEQVPLRGQVLAVQTAGLARHHRPPTKGQTCRLEGACGCGWIFSASVQGYRVTGAPPPHGHDGTTRCQHCGEPWARPGSPGWGPEVEQVQIEMPDDAEGGMRS